MRFPAGTVCGLQPCEGISAAQAGKLREKHGTAPGYALCQVE